MLIIGVTGKAVSGKSEAAAYLAHEHNFIHLDFTKDLLAPLLEERHRAVTRKNLVELALEMRKTGGKAALMKKLAENIGAGKGYVIAGIRYPEEVNFMRSRFPETFRLLAVKCSLQTRYRRTLEIYEVRKKQSGGRDLTFREFMEMEDLPTEKIISRTIRMADFSVTNEGTKKEFYSRLDSIVKRLKV